MQLEVQSRAARRGRLRPGPAAAGWAGPAREVGKDQPVTVTGSQSRFKFTSAMVTGLDTMPQCQADSGLLDDAGGTQCRTGRP
jgi:hypothetical protein